MIETVGDKLSAFLQEAAKRTFELREWDCGLWLADWYVFKTGNPDPATHLRGKYYGPNDLLKYIGSIVLELDLKWPGLKPERGDIGVLQIRENNVGAICTGKHWVVLGKRGLSSISVSEINPLYMWRIP